MAAELFRIILPWLLIFIAALTTTASCNEIVYVTVTTTVEAATTAQTQPTVPIPDSYTSLSDFKVTSLRVSNEYRSAHNATPLVWNETLMEYAQNWADTCIWKHSGGPYGENIAFGYPNASAAVAAWGDEGRLYDFERPTGFTEETGHFTQLVWKSTTQVGCAAINCGYTQNNRVRRDVDGGSSHVVSRAADGGRRAQGWYVVCEYTPGGNIVGSHGRYFRLNVLPRKSSTNESSGGASTKGKVDSAVRTMLMALSTMALRMGLNT